MPSLQNYVLIIHSKSKGTIAFCCLGWLQQQLECVVAELWSYPLGVGLLDIAYPGVPQV